MNLKKNFVITTLVMVGVDVVLLLGGCSFKNTTSARFQNQPEGKRPEDLLAKIKVGMTIDEIAQVIPLSTNFVGMQTAGSIWFHVPFDENYTLRLRFSRPEPADGSLNTITLNRAPEMILKGDAR